VSSPADRFATPRVAAGALFVEGNRILLVRKTYGNRWDIPGGYVDIGESPAQACTREIREELGLDRSPTRLLVNDWAPSETEGDKLLYIFSCGPLGTDEARVTLDHEELDTWEWVPVNLIDQYAIPRLARRLKAAYRAHLDDASIYLERGENALPATQEAP
jgi:8-oxo-dGTP pyrophosphatase MutT (NUDIX family)